MDIGSIGSAVRRLTAVVSRRRFGMTAVGLALGTPAAAAGKNPRCRKRRAACARSSQCCSKKTRCATSHGSGSNTCCGGKGATCGSTLTCCVPLMCEGGRCVQPEAQP